MAWISDSNWKRGSVRKMFDRFGVPIMHRHDFLIFSSNGKPREPRRVLSRGGKPPQIFRERRTNPGFSMFYWTANSKLKGLLFVLYTFQKWNKLKNLNIIYIIFFRRWGMRLKLNVYRSLNKPLNSIGHLFIYSREKIGFI